MAQIFPRSANVLSKASIVGVVLLVSALGAVAAGIVRSSYVTNQDIARTQPIQFSHAHHVNGLGIDCRYCHNTVEDASFANVPPTKTCMNCHSQIWVGSPMLEPVRESYRTGKSIEWDRIHRLADFVYFDHSIHISKGVGCTECHGRIDHMQAVFQKGSLLMEWCLDCHNDPGPRLRPREDVFKHDWTFADVKGPDGKPKYASRQELGRELVDRFKIRKLTECSTCHR